MSAGFRVFAVPTPKLTLPFMAAPGRISRLLAPMLAMVFSKALREPSPISVMAMTAPTPMITPSPVRIDRILFRRKCADRRAEGGRNERGRANVPRSPFAPAWPESVCGARAVLAAGADRHFRPRR